MGKDDQAGKSPADANTVPLVGDEKEGKGKKARSKRTRNDDAGLDEKRLKFLERNRSVRLVVNPRIR